MNNNSLSLSLSIIVNTQHLRCPFFKPNWQLKLTKLSFTLQSFKITYDSEILWILNGLNVVILLLISGWTKLRRKNKFNVNNIGIKIWIIVCDLWRYCNKKFFHIKSRNLSKILAVLRSHSSIRLCISTLLSDGLKLTPNVWVSSVLLLSVNCVMLVKNKKIIHNKAKN